MKYDVVVVGGRVAGSTSSLFASKGGLDVIMIEKRQEIGTPVQCGEATTTDTFKTLEMKPSKKYLRTQIKGADIYSPIIHTSGLKVAVFTNLRKDMF